MNEEKIAGIIADLKRWLKGKNLDVLLERPLPHGHQIRIKEGKDQVSVNIYTSGTIHIQGKACQLKERLKAYKRDIEPPPPPERGLARIGLDESGKGDYFGPLVIAAVFVDAQAEGKLEEWGVKDSKRLSDASVRTLAQQIEATFPHAVVSIGPKRYNELMAQIGNLNRLLAWGHARTLENLLGQVDCQLAIADQFGDERLLQEALLKHGRRITLRQRPRAEEDAAVAAASIVARHDFMARLELLSKRVGVDLPKGASSVVVQVAQQIVHRCGKDILREIAKLHFKTTKAIIRQGHGMPCPCCAMMNVPDGI